MERLKGVGGLNNVLIDIASPLTYIVQSFVSFWNWLDTIILVPEFGLGFSLLDLFVAAIVIGWALFLFFGFKGGDEE